MLAKKVLKPKKIPACSSVAADTQQLNIKVQYLLLTCDLIQSQKEVSVALEADVRQSSSPPQKILCLQNGSRSHCREYLPLWFLNELGNFHVIRLQKVIGQLSDRIDT